MRWYDIKQNQKHGKSVSADSNQVGEINVLGYKLVNIGLPGSKCEGHSPWGKLKPLLSKQ